MKFAPEFIDNRDGNTLAEALAQISGGRIGGVSPDGVRPAELAIAAAFFSPKGLDDLPPISMAYNGCVSFSVSRRRATSKSAGRTR